MTNNTSIELFQKVVNLCWQVQVSNGDCVEAMVALWELVHFSLKDNLSPH